MSLGHRRRWLWHTVWGLLAVPILAACIAGAPLRVRELIVPAQDTSETVTMGRLTAAEQAALEGIGIPIPALILYEEILALALVALCTVIAAILYWRRSDSRIAWVASLFLIINSTTVTFNALALSRAHPALSVISSLQLALTLLFPALLFYLFPNGRFVPRWTRWPVLAFGVFLLAQVLLPMLSPAQPQEHPAPGIALGALVFVGGVVSQIHRYLRVSTPAERQQTKWIVVALGIQALVFAVVAFTTQLAPGIFAAPLANALWEFGLFQLYVVTFALIPVAMTFSVLRYRLWDIDLIINRSLVYGALTLILVLFMLGVVAGVRVVMLELTDGEQLPVALALAAMAAGLLFQPARRLLQQLVDRRVYGIEIDYQRAAPARRRDPDATHSPARSLEELGDYEDIRWIGRGGMADVFRARHTRLDRDVAIKVLPPVSGGELPESVQRFEREARIVAALRHPNIVQLYDYGKTPDGTWYLAMEYISPTDLRGHLREVTRLELGPAVVLLGEVAAALDHAHGQGIVHRDIKPSNVLLAPVDAPDAALPFRAVLSDFGIAKLTGATSLTQQSVMGTLDYIAPEQIRDAADVDHRADLYSFGVMAYHVLTGELPFTRNTPVSLMLAHLNQPAPDPRERVPDLPRLAAKAVVRAMSKDPQLRFDSATEMVARMEQALRR